jgi:hypothetical protein
MPWSCNCPREQRDDVNTCASCAAVKEVWTLHADKTRSLVVTRQRLEALRGGRFTSRGEGDRLVPATRAVALRKRAIRDLAAVGEEPPSGRLLVVQGPGAARVTVEVQPASGEPREHELTIDDETSQLRLVLAYGPLDEPLAADALPGHHTIDVSDDSPAGHAARLRLSLKGRSPVGLPIHGEPPALLAARLTLLLDRPTGLVEVLRSGACRLRPLEAEDAPEEATTDSAGVLRHEVATPGRWVIEALRGERVHTAELSTGPATFEPLELVLVPDDPGEEPDDPEGADSPGEVGASSVAGGAP